MTPVNSLSAGVVDTVEQFISDVVGTGHNIFPPVVDTGQKLPKNLKFITVVNDTAEKLFTGVNDTTDKFFASVNNTADKTVLPILACLQLKMKNKQKFDL